MSVGPEILPIILMVLMIIVFFISVIKSYRDSKRMVERNDEAIERVLESLDSLINTIEERDK